MAIPSVIFIRYVKEYGEKVNKFVLEVLTFVLLSMAALGLIHQQLTTSDPWFDFHEIVNHESVVICLIASAISLLVGKYLGKLGL